MQTKQIVSLLLFLLAAGLLVWWVVAGHQMWTTTQHMVEVKDELFGTVSQQWEKGLIPGLEFIGPAVALLVAGGIWCLRKSRK